ncbi:hypothetical protein PENCOP_c011G00738 [Penicillium coprophilum]|uniref:Uncharacterized protein n=1 Tax=Penicillium coprophilum TaxID=36646 RepID=A0A1V6UEP8_9EURO|nr:hypothetical protein PENCOP_c011G00738 [Penicillium coprophilum]
MFEHLWYDLPNQLGGAVAKFNEVITHDPQFLAFTNSEHITEPISFGMNSIGSENYLVFTFKQGSGNVRSFWALYGQNIRQEGVEALGDKLAFAKYAHIWRSMFDVLHDVYCGPNDAQPQAEPEENFLIGRENAYLECVAGVIKALKLKQPILCGASMAGQACIAAAICAEGVGIMGSILLQGCERVEMHREWYDKSPMIISATSNPEWAYGVSFPTPDSTNYSNLEIDDVPDCPGREPKAIVAHIHRHLSLATFFLMSVEFLPAELIHLIASLSPSESSITALAS